MASVTSLDIRQVSCRALLVGLMHCCFPTVRQAEEIRTRRDNEAWLSRVASGFDTPIQDPLSLLGGCVESSRRLKEAFDRVHCGGGVLPAAASRETEDRYSERRCNYGACHCLATKLFGSPVRPPA